LPCECRWYHRTNDLHVRQHCLQENFVLGFNFLGVVIGSDRTTSCNNAINSLRRDAGSRRISPCGSTVRSQIMWKNTLDLRTEFSIIFGLEVIK
jgi:hypothetical protein